MCGICGMFARDAVADEHALDAMMSVLQHRGPDGAGKFVSGEIGLGHLRLSIIDVEGGSQPIDNERGTLQVVFNGEIYNFVELRQELESLGHRFRTRSDTEVIVHAYEQWGKACTKRFNGMFAFALWDTERRELFIARDHLGIKPLYYVDLGTRFLFASEIKSLLQDRMCPRDVDMEALAQLFTFRYVPSPKTLFRNVYKLPPGHSLTLSRRGLEIERFWEWIPGSPVQRSEGALIEEYQALLEDAVRLQLRSDVPLGLFLSSGIDSGVLLAIMSRYSSEPVRAFTIGFDGGEDCDEVVSAHDLAGMFGARHEFLMIGPADYEKYYERYLWDLEEPVGNETAAAFYFVSRITSQHVKVALTGQGADEPWAGYQRYVGAKLSSVYSRIPVGITQGVARLVAHVPGRSERLKRGAISLGERDPLTRFTKMYSFFSADMKSQLFHASLKAELTSNAHEPREALRRLQRDVEHLDPLTQMLYIDTRASLPDDLLMVGDKMSMANSLEARVPFLDHRLVEFIERLPPGMKLRGLTGKYLHKKALEKWLPRTRVWQKKKGFANPIENWFRDRMRPFVEMCLLSSDSAVAHYFDQSYIRRMLARDRRGIEQLRRHIYLLVSFELWHRRFIRAETPDASWIFRSSSLTGTRATI
jgi:asparagine synthase (glutamine-hydrolysing)